MSLLYQHVHLRHYQLVTVLVCHVVKDTEIEVAVNLKGPMQLEIGLINGERHNPVVLRTEQRGFRSSPASHCLDPITIQVVVGYTRCTLVWYLLEQALQQYTMPVVIILPKVSTQH